MRLDGSWRTSTQETVLDAALSVVRTVAPHLDAAHPAQALIAWYGIVLQAAIVPNNQRAGIPYVTALEVRTRRDQVEQVVQNRIALCRFKPTIWVVKPDSHTAVSCR